MSRKLSALLFVLVTSQHAVGRLRRPGCTVLPRRRRQQANHISSQDSIQINGAGATFPVPVYTEWIFAYQYVDPSVSINYQGIGSGGGKKAIIDGTVDFAGSDSLVTADEYTAGKDLQMYPMVAGAVVLIYNIEGLAARCPGPGTGSGHPGRHL